MGSLVSAVNDDINDYVRRCKKYGENVKMSKTIHGIDLPDCYGEHAQQLEDRERAEFKKAELESSQHGQS